MTAAPIIRYEGVKKAFGPKVVYEDLSLSVYPGETLTIIGGSGTGKSVALKLLIGLLTPDDGHIWFDGSDLARPQTYQRWVEVRRDISMLFQSGALFDSLNVFENVAYGLRERDRSLTDADLAPVVAEKLTLVGLPGIEEMRPADLSGGMRKRVALARAIAMSPRVVLYDEPTTGLDPVNTSRINVLIRSLQQKLGVTSIVVTHDMSTVRSVSDRVAMVYQGRIIFEDTIAALHATRDRRVLDFVEGAFDDMRGTTSDLPARPLSA